MKVPLLLVLLLAPLTAFVPAGSAADCGETMRVTRGVYYVEVRDNSGIAYVYRESNGFPDLQRGSAQPLTGEPDDCVDSLDVRPDERIA